MPRSKHHKKNMTDKQWRRRKNKRKASGRIRDKVAARPKSAPVRKNQTFLDP